MVCRKFRRTTQTKKSSAQLSAHENFFLKNTTSGKRLIFNTSRCGIYPIYFPLWYISNLPPKSPIFGTKLPKCRRYGITIIYRGINIWHTIATDEAQLAHRYDTVVAKWSRSLRETWKRPKSNRKPIEVPEISYGGPLIYKSLFLYQRYTKGIQKASIYWKSTKIFAQLKINHYLCSEFVQKQLFVQKKWTKPKYWTSK